MAEGHHGDLTRETFPLPSLAPRIAEWNSTLSDGHGFLLVHGFPVDELDEAGIEVVGTCSSGGELIEVLETRSPVDVVVLDLGLPGTDGVTWLRRWRERGVASPVLILTARDAVTDRVKGLDLGADDYLTKPFGRAELIARIGAVMRRADERRSVSMMISSSIRWSFAGKLVDCRMNMSSPRTFSSTSTKISLSEKRRILALTSGSASLAEMASASGRLLLPVRIFIVKPLISNEKTATPGRDAAEHTNRPRRCKRPEIRDKSSLRRPRAEPQGSGFRPQAWAGRFIMATNASTEPAKRFYKYARPWRWSSDVKVEPTLLPARGSTTATERIFCCSGAIPGGAIPCSASAVAAAISRRRACTMPLSV